MKPTAIAALIFVLPFAHIATATASPENQQACEQGKAEYEKEGMTMDDCLCMLGEADKHMSPEMKQAFVESLLANERNPLQRFMQLGVSMEDLMQVMDAYSSGVEQSCGV